ncbi:MAG: hypothetical protein ACI4F3_08685 [Enterocloster sp.]
MVIINAPLKADVFKSLAEAEGLTFVKKAGMKMYFENPAGNDSEKAAELKKMFKNHSELAAVFFQVAAE